MTSNKRGRPAMGGRQIYVRVPESLYQQVHREAAASGLGISDVVRQTLMAKFPRKESTDGRVGDQAKARRAGKVSRQQDRRGDVGNRCSGD